MTRKGKTTRYLIGGTIGVILLVLVIRFVSIRSYTSQLPILVDTQQIALPVLDQIDAAMAKAKRNPSAKNIGTLGMIYHSSANYSQAGECYKLAFEKDGSEWIWSYYLGYLLTEMGDSEGAILSFAQVLEKHPNMDLARYYGGEELKNLGSYEEAVKQLSQIQLVIGNETPARGSIRKDHFPLAIYARFQLARIYFETEQSDLAERTLKEIIEISRTFGPAYRLLGNIYKLKGDEALSEHYGVRANELMELSPPVDTLIDKLSLLSTSNLYLPKKIDEAISAVYPHWALTLINHSLSYYPNDPYLIAKAIRTNLWLGRVNEASQYLGQHLSSFENDFAELSSMAGTLYNEELYPQSIDYWNRALLLKPGDLEIQKNLAISHGKMGEKERSQAIFDEILKDNPENFEVLAEVADLLFFELEDRQKALGYLVLLDYFVPTNPKVQKMTAWMAQANGDLLEAIKLYESSFKGDHEDFTTIKNLGALYISQKMWANSIQLFREALSYHPNEPYFLERLGALLVSCPDPAYRNMEEGKYYSERAFTHSTDNTMIILSAGRNLAIASANLGEMSYAFLVLNSTIQMARERNLPQQNLQVLEDLAKELQEMAE